MVASPGAGAAQRAILRANRQESSDHRRTHGPAPGAHSPPAKTLPARAFCLGPPRSLCPSRARLTLVTKARDLVSRIRRAAKAAGVPFTLDREGGKHTIYTLGT